MLRWNCPAYRIAPFAALVVLSLQTAAWAQSDPLADAAVAAEFGAEVPGSEVAPDSGVTGPNETGPNQEAVPDQAAAPSVTPPESAIIAPVPTGVNPQSVKPETVALRSI